MSPRLHPLSLPAMALLWAGCGPSNLTWVSEVSGCDDFDYDAPAPPELSAQVNGSTVAVQLSNVLVPGDSDFEPELNVDGGDIEVLERWTGGTDDDFCYNARVLLQDASGTLQVYWFREGEDVAFDNITVEVD